MTPLFLPPQLELRPFRIWRKPLSATQSPPTPSSSPQGAGDERIQQVSFISRLLSRPEFGALVGAILVFIAFSIFSWDAKDNFPDFLKLQAVVIWLKFAAEIGILGIGATLLMISGEFDLSIGSIIAVSGVITLAPIVYFGWSPSAAILLTLAVVLVMGWINGTIVNWTGLPSFIVTLAFLYIYRGVTLVSIRGLTGGSTRVDIAGLIGQRDITSVPQAREMVQGDFLAQMFNGNIWGSPKVVQWLADLGMIPMRTRNILQDGVRVPVETPIIEGIPVAVAWWIILLFIAIFVLQRTRFGNWIYGTGGHEESARNMGVPTKRVKVILFMVTAFCAFVYATLQAIEFGSVDSLRGNLKEFEAIIVAVIGGTILTGGYGAAVGAFWGALIYGMLARGIEITQWMESDWFRIILGIGLLLAVIFNTFIRKRATESR